MIKGVLIVLVALPVILFCLLGIGVACFFMFDICMKVEGIWKLGVPLAFVGYYYIVRAYDLGRIAR